MSEITSKDTFRVVSVSGGKDSTAMYLWAMEQFGRRFEAVFADTGHEHPVTVNYVKNMHLMAGGPKVDIVKADFTDKLKNSKIPPSGIPFLDMILWKQMMPTGNKQFCTSHLKLEPIRDWIEAKRGDREVVVYLGIRAEESLKRSKLPKSEFSEFYDGYIERPLIEWKVEEVFALMKKKGVTPNPLYEKGMSRVGCYPCINANKSDLALLPDSAWQKIKEWEEKLGVPWFKPGLVPGKERASIDEVREWATTLRGGKFIDQTKFFKTDNDVPSCVATWNLCE